jgi:hypothetical protein
LSIKAARIVPQTLRRSYTACSLMGLVGSSHACVALANPPHLSPHPCGSAQGLWDFRECVLDVGRVPTGGSQPRRPLLKSRFHRVERALPTGRCLSLHPVLCLPARVPMSSTHSRRFCKIGAGFRGQSAHLAWNSAPLHTCRWRISPGILQLLVNALLACFVCWAYA